MPGNWLVGEEEPLRLFCSHVHLALERATLSTKSLIIGLAVIKKHLSVEQAAKTSAVEVDAQIQVWGEVEDSMSNLMSPSFSTF